MATMFGRSKVRVNFRRETLDADHKPKTELLDELEKGLAQLRQGNQVGWPDQRQRSGSPPPTGAFLPREKGHWKHGGLSGARLCGGVIGRYSDVGEQFPMSPLHTIRVNQPAGWFIPVTPFAPSATSGSVTALALPTCTVHRRHHSAGHAHPELEPTFKNWHRPGSIWRLRIFVPHAFLLRRHGALRMGLLRRDEAVLRPDHGLPGRDASSTFPLQVQTQVRRLSQ